MRISPRFSLAILLSLLFPAVAAAIWAVNGNPVCTATAVQQDIDITANGLGGAVMVWQDHRGTSPDIYARQIERFGAAEWTPNGVALCTATGSQATPHVVHDGYGYLLYTWEDYRSGTADLYGAITDRLGNVFTNPDGFPICASTGAQEFSALTSDPLYGVGYVAWTDTRGGGNDIYAQAFNVSNLAFWPQDGLAFCTDASDQSFPAIATDGADGAIVAWQDSRRGNADIYAQRANLNGDLLWAADGVVVCVQTSGQIRPMIVSDGAGGAIVAWEDFRHGVNAGAIYAQRIDASGVRQWGHNGVQIVLSSDLVYLPRMIPDGAGGAIIAWADDRNSATTGPDLYAQRIDTNGDVLWTLNGAVVCSATFAQSGIDIAPDGAQGVIATWQDLRLLGPSDVYAQRMNAAGIPVWATNGVLICNATGNQYKVQIAQGDEGESLIAWQDKRTGAIDDVYAQRIDDTGSSQSGVGDTPAIPRALLLLPNTPNPFSGSTALRVGVPQAGEGRLDVYDVAGRHLASRDLGTLSAGWRDVVFDGRGDNGRPLAGGVYVYRVSVGGAVHSRSMIINR